MVFQAIRLAGVFKQFDWLGYLSDLTGWDLRAIGMAGVFKQSDWMGVFEQSDWLWSSSDQTGWGFQALRIEEYHWCTNPLL